MQENGGGYFKPTHGGCYPGSVSEKNPYELGKPEFCWKIHLERGNPHRLTQKPRSIDFMWSKE